MRIIVCIKQVLDPEMPASSFCVDRENKSVFPPEGVPPVLSPFDENAIEAALRLKDDYGAEVAALSMGRKLSRPVVKKSLSAGADELFLVEGDAFEGMDGFGWARTLAAAIPRMGDYDIILTGRQAADWDAGVTGPVLAEFLDLPCISLARKIEANEDKILVERVTDDGYERVETAMPCVITVSNELGELRQITLPGINKARQKPLTEWNQADIGMEDPLPPRCELVDLYIPQRDTICEFIEGETPEDKAQKLADIICGNLHG